MIKKAISALALLCSVAYASATVNYMIVEQKDGEKFSFLLSDNPQITYVNRNLVINGSASTSYAFDDVKNYHFAEDAKVENNDAEMFRIVNLDDATIEVQNIQTADKVVLINASGVVMSTSTADVHGVATVSLPKQKGVYVLLVSNKSFKIIRN